MRPFPRWMASAALVVSMLNPVYGAQDRPVTVAVSIPPQKFLLDWIGGDRIRVHVMLEPGQAPETFEPTPRQMAVLAEAQVYFRIGVPFEGAWLNSTQAVNTSLAVVDCCNQFAAETQANGRPNPDPHVWVSPITALNIAELMTQELIRLDPPGRQNYASNFRDLRVALKQLDREIGNLLENRRTPYFIISHDSLGPFAEAYGLIQLSLEAGGKAAGPRAISE
ncbi:MAG: metal ABC transporter solute-binding protein, Zn/Mn family, partial [Gammaproteobacteria bacterium]